jgi:hypothetical protein
MDGSPVRRAGLVLLVAVFLAGCGSTGASDYPTLEPLDDILARADSAFSRPAGT